MRAPGWPRKAIAGYRPLESREAAEIAARAASGDDAARWEFALSVAPIVRRLAWRAARQCGRAWLMEELADAGILEVARRCGSYDAGRASPCVFAEQVSRAGFRSALVELGYPCRLPPYHVEPKGERARGRDARRRAGTLLAAAAAKASPEGFGQVPAWLDARATPDEASGALERDELLARLREARGWLSPRERRVLALRYRVGLTQREAGRWLGVSNERARQIEVAAIRRLRAALGVEAIGA